MLLLLVLQVEGVGEGEGETEKGELLPERTGGRKHEGILEGMGARRLGEGLVLKMGENPALLS